MALKVQTRSNKRYFTLDHRNDLRVAHRFNVVDSIKIPIVHKILALTAVQPTTANLHCYVKGKGRNVISTMGSKNTPRHLELEAPYKNDVLSPGHVIEHVHPSSIRQRHSADKHGSCPRKTDTSRRLEWAMVVAFWGRFDPAVFRG